MAVIRPHSSKLAEFISSCMPFGWKGMASCAPVPSLAAPSVSNLKAKLLVGVVCSWIRANPSHFAVGVVGLLHQPLATKLLP